MNVPRLLAAAAMLVVSVPQPARADPVHDCTTATGVIVAVDFSHFGGHVERGCDARPTTSFDALHVAGFHTEGDTEDGPAFVCRIDGYPTPKQDPCTRTPPSSAYWSLWHANSGQDSWSYTSSGSMSWHPKPGSVDAWVFGATDTSGSSGGPDFSPASVRATNAPVTPRPTRADAHAHPSSRTPRPSPTMSTPVRPSPSRHPASRRHVRSQPPAVTPGPTDSTGPVITDVSPQAQHTTAAHNAPTATIIGVGLVVALGALAAGAAWRRRRSS